MNCHQKITELLYRYGRFIDQGDLDGACSLFKHAKIKTVDRTELGDYKNMADMLKKFVKIYDDGTPRTKHLINNVIIDIDAAGSAAKSSAYYTVIQSVEPGDIKIVAAGQYVDEFERVDGEWRFSYRDLTVFEMQGDLSGHLLLG